MPATIPKERIEALTGKKVEIATRGWHHVCGILEGARGERLVVHVAGRELLIDRWAVISMIEAVPEEAEFVK